MIKSVSFVDGTFDAADTPLVSSWDSSYFDHPRSRCGVEWVETTGLAANHNLSLPILANVHTRVIGPHKKLGLDD
jgi:hypothetical protein